MIHRQAANLLFCGALIVLYCQPARSDVNVAPEALKHYSYCISEAKDRNQVYDLDRYVLYRCHGDIAVSYFNYLGRRRVPDVYRRENTGEFTYRYISGIGRCWNKTVNAYGESVSEYGCDVYVQI
jgi:hypothetical protein